MNQAIPMNEAAYAREVAERWWREVAEGDATHESIQGRLSQLWAPRAVLVRSELNRLRLARRQRVYVYELSEQEQQQLIADYQAAVQGLGGGDAPQH